jgi:cyanate lyase
MDHCYMDIYAVRLENLRRLMRERYDNKQSVLARSAGISTSYISFLFTGRKRLGETLARAVERQLYLEPNSLDRPSVQTFTVTEPQIPYKPANPRTRRLIARLSEAEAQGRLDDADIAAIEGIVSRLLHKTRPSV